MDMVMQRRDSPSWLHEHDDDDDDECPQCTAQGDTDLLPV